MYKIEFADGTALEGLSLNGNNFFSASPIEKSYFTADKLKKVIFSKTGGGSAEYEEMWLAHCIPLDGGTEFILAEVSAEQKKENALNAQLDAIMLALCDVYEAGLGV